MSITLYPTPSPDGVGRLKDYYRTQCQMEVSDETCFEVLAGIMRFIYLTEIKPPRPQDPNANLSTNHP